MLLAERALSTSSDLTQSSVRSTTKQQIPGLATRPLRPAAARPFEFVNRVIDWVNTRIPSYGVEPDGVDLNPKSDKSVGQSDTRGELREFCVIESCTVVRGSAIHATGAPENFVIFQYVTVE